MPGLASVPYLGVGALGADVGHSVVRLDGREGIRGDLGRGQGGRGEEGGLADVRLADYSDLHSSRSL